MIRLTNLDEVFAEIMKVLKKILLTVRLTVLGWREGINITKYSVQIGLNLK